MTPELRKSSRLRGQRSRSQRDESCAKIRQIINNSAGDCSTSFKIRTDFDHLTLDGPTNFQGQWVKGQGHSVNNVSASRKTLISTVSCRRSNLVKIIPEPSATRNAIFKVMRSNTKIAITPPRIARLRLNLVQSFITSQAIRCKRSRSKGQSSKSQRKVMYQQQKNG